MKLTLIRGLPGSGKSTLAKTLPAVHLEADMFFIQDEVYCYDPALISQAHQWCERQTALSLQQGLAVVVSNTFVQWWQIEPYILLAKRHKVAVRLIEARGNYQNVHAVPEVVIEAIQAGYENYDSIVRQILTIIPPTQLRLTAPESVFTEVESLSSAFPA
jgi:predicted kinase